MSDCCIQMLIISKYLLAMTVFLPKFQVFQFIIVEDVYVDINYYIMYNAYIGKIQYILHKTQTWLKP